ncbi:hypothetical protein [Burkholderia ubonensis]|uniref:hypothetical protein n=1 Tax=Burkholderia ubonensis TaxID=101571 RepID=UPI0012F9AADB|nr:hypothetical protein [Burkholderia ubonensis]
MSRPFEIAHPAENEIVAPGGKNRDGWRMENNLSIRHHWGELERLRIAYNKHSNRIGK